MADVLFISPHPDDESLSMGMGITNHVWYGHNVYVALLTRGRVSAAIDDINGNTLCTWHNVYHNPQQEGYSPLSVQEFADARVNEFKYSVGCLGVKVENLKFYDLNDGKISKEDVKSIIRNFISSHPGGVIKTPSYYDIHPDHSACGDALLELYNDGEVDDARFYVSPNQWDSTPGYYEFNPNCTIFHDASLAVYKRWNPSRGIYGVGYHSVSTMFDLVSQELKSKYHIPGE